MTQQIITLLFDKVLLGTVTLIVGFVLARHLERFKGSVALRNEMAKLRVTKIAECWLSLSALEAVLLKASKAYEGVVQQWIKDDFPDDIVRRRNFYSVKVAIRFGMVQQSAC